MYNHTAAISVIPIGIMNRSNIISINSARDEDMASAIDTPAPSPF